MIFTNYQMREMRVRKVENTRHRFPAGTRVMITRYKGYDVPTQKGLATVNLVDDLGVIKVTRDDGTVARIIPGIDRIRFLTDAEMRAEAEKRIVERERQKY